MTRILLVRHGESEWNAAGRWQGQADPPLTDLGRAQALAAAAAIGAVDAVACSDLERARVTAELIADRIGIGPVLVDPGFRERDAGEWSGLTRSEIHRDWPGYLPDDPAARTASQGASAASQGASAASQGDGRRPPSWEPDDQLLRRAMGALGRLADTVGDGDAVVVTHGGVVYAIEAALDEPWHRLPNLGARWVTVAGDRLTLGERLVLVDPHDVTVTTPDQI